MDKNALEKHDTPNTYEHQVAERFNNNIMQNQLKKEEREELKKVILERRFEDDNLFLPLPFPNRLEHHREILSLPPNRRDFWMRINRIYELSRIAITSKMQIQIMNEIYQSVSNVNPFLGNFYQDNPKSWKLTPDQLIEGIEKYIPHLLVDYEWKLFEKIKRYKHEGRKIKGLQELMYCVAEFSGSLLYMGGKGFVENHNQVNPNWDWTFDEVSSDIHFSPKGWKGTK